MRIERCNDPHVLARLNRDVQNLHARMYPDLFRPYDADAVERFFSRTLGQSDWTHFVAYEGEEAVGFIQLEKRTILNHPFRKDAEILYVHQICVRQESTGRGVGTALMDMAKKHARELRIGRLELDVWTKNEHAASFFEKMGYHSFKRQMESLT